jgi:hypothetical protein
VSLFSRFGPGVLDQPRDARETLLAARSHRASQVARHLTVRRRDAPAGIASRSPSKWRNDLEGTGGLDTLPCVCGVHRESSFMPTVSLVVERAPSHQSRSPRFLEGASANMPGFGGSSEEIGRDERGLVFCPVLRERARMRNGGNQSCHAGYRIVLSVRIPFAPPANL